MAIFHMNVSTGSRGGGQSAGAKADYILREGSYSRDDKEVEFSTSGNMPDWAQENPKDYWRAADTFERVNGRLFKQVEFALPKELSRERQRELVKEFAKKLTKDETLPYTLAIHKGKDTNPHCHLMISERRTDDVKRKREQWFKRYNRKNPERGGAQKTTSLMPKKWLEQTRENLAKHINIELERAGFDERVDHRSYKDQGIDKIPGMHLGPRAAAMQKRALAAPEKGIVVDRAKAYAQHAKMQKDRINLVKERSMLDFEIQKIDRANNLNKLHMLNEERLRQRSFEKQQVQASEPLRIEDPSLNQMDQQLDAMGAKNFDLVLVELRSQKQLRLTLEKKEIQKQAIWLAEMNRKGHAIYIRPAKIEPRQEVGIVLVKDISLDSLKEMAQKGCNPAAVIQKDEKKFEGWVKIRGMDSQEKEQKVARFLAVVHFADSKRAKANAWGRLAGFERGDFKVKCIEATGVIAKASDKILDRALQRGRKYDFGRER